MEIVSLGHAGFRLRSKDVAVVIDPPSPALGYSVKGISADVVCVTHDHPGHNFTQGIGGAPYVVSGPGEYEIKGVLITALRSFHDAKRGEERGRNTIYLLHMEDLLICHLGDLGHPLTADQRQEATGADVLMVPVGGHSTIDAKAAAEIVAELEPGIVIPMHYGTTQLKTGVPLDPVEHFFSVMGVPVAEPVAKLVVTRSTIPATPQIVVLSTRG